MIENDYKLERIQKEMVVACFNQISKSTLRGGLSKLSKHLSEGRLSPESVSMPIHPV
jgi:hypothetical protein